MKKVFLHIMIICLFVSVSFASYTYTITEYQMLPSLTGTQSMLITDNGGGPYQYLSGNSSVIIQSTSVLEDGVGGVWHISLTENSFIDISGGQVNQLDLNNDATAVLSGGLIQQIWSYQSAWKQAGDPPAPVSNPHITIVYSDVLPTVNASNILTGLWGDGSAFSIQLHDVQGYSPVIENIQFQQIPEPVVSLFIVFGAALLRKGRKIQ